MKSLSTLGQPYSRRHTGGLLAPNYKEVMLAVWLMRQPSLSDQQ